jgi:hypothetical protein
MNIIRANGIPLWITIVALLIGLLGTAIGIMALLDPTAAFGYIDGADSIARTWAGRNAGLGVALLVAVALRNANGYAVAFAGSIMREISDILDILNGGVGTLAVIGAFLLVDVICFGISVRAARRGLSMKAG